MCTINYQNHQSNSNNCDNINHKINNFYLVPVNPKIPLLKAKNFPKDLISDIVDGKNIKMRYYIAKLIGW